MSQGANNLYNALTPQQQQAIYANRQAAAAAAQWQQPPARTASPAPGQQQPAAAALAQLQAAQNFQAIQNNPTLLRAFLANQGTLQGPQAAAAIAQLAQAQQQLPAPPQRARPGPAAAARPHAAASLASAGSAGNLAAVGAAAAGLGLSQAAALQRPGSSQGLGAPAGTRPLSAGSMFSSRGMGMGGMPGSSPGPSDADAATKAKVQAAMKAMKPNEAPKVEPPEGYEWVQCAGKDGKPAWFAVVRAKAQAMRTATAAKRKAQEAPAGQPGGKGGGKKKGEFDPDAAGLVAGGGPVSMMLMTDDAVEAEEEAAKGAVVAEAGNVQEEYLLNPTATMRMVARLAKEGGVKAVSDSVYPFLSLAAETYLAQMLNSMIKMRLQREDLGKGYFGFDQGETTLRADLYKMREREKREAEKRAEIERDELAKLGASRKKLGEEERKAAQAARQARDIEEKKAKLGGTLSLLGIGHASFASFGKAPTRTGTSKPGFTKAELSDVKAANDAAAAAAATAAISAAASSAAATPQQDGTARVKLEPGSAAAAAAGAGMDPQQGAPPVGAAGPSSGQSPAQQPASSAAAAAASGPAPLRPMSYQHQLLSAADVASQSAVFVAGGVPPRKARDGDDSSLRDLMLADLVAVLERHPLYCRSPELYMLQTLAALQADGMK